MDAVTAMYAPDSAWSDTIVELEDISKTIMESHLIEGLAWCETLVAASGTKIETLNGQLWDVTVNENGKPCFETYDPDGELYKACVVVCDILASNGIVHLLDDVLLLQAFTESPTTPTTAPSTASPTASPTESPTTPPTASPTISQTTPPSRIPTIVLSSTPIAPPTRPPFQCTDDSTWSIIFANGSSRRCRWVRRRPETRCRLSDQSGRWAFEACPRSCAKKQQWRAELGPPDNRRTVGCRWVRANPNRRCRVRGVDRRPAFAGCSLACCRYNKVRRERRKKTVDLDGVNAEGEGDVDIAFSENVFDRL